MCVALLTLFRPKRAKLELMTLRWRLTLLYTSLMSVLLTLVVIAAMLLMERNMVANLDSALLDTHRQFESSVGQLRLLAPETARERGSDDSLPRARYQFPNDAIQIEDLSLYGHDLLNSLFSGVHTADTKRVLLQNIRILQQATRQTVTGVSRHAPILLTDQQLQALVISNSGRLYFNQELKVPSSDKPELYRILVTLGPMYLEEPAPPSRSWNEVGGTEALQQGQQNHVLPSSAALQPNYVLTYVGRSLGNVVATNYALQKLMIILSFVGVGLGSLSAYFLVGGALKPLQRVRQAAERIGGQNLTERVPVPDTCDEVAVLAGSLNAMLGRLENSFAAQRQFTSDASHELRTPVTAISGHAGYLLRRTNPNEQQVESLRIIQAESERLTNLISNLLQLARSDSGVLNLSLGPVWAEHFLQDIARELEPIASAQGSVILVSSADVVFEADSDRLKQVMINLVGNALKAGAAHILLRGFSDGVVVRFTVQDDGGGIPPEHLGRLFDRFYRVEDSRSRHQGGAGLGLSIAQGIVQAHEGRIWLESVFGEGTWAHVELPLGNIPLEDDIA